jgi:hypothetical protein
MVRCIGWGVALAVVVLFWLPAAAADPDPWEDCRFLLGDWSGEGQGAPGAEKGQFSFRLELQDKVIVRKHKAEVAAAGGRPASTHEDMMVIHADGAGKGLRAVYFDSEGHVIHYALTLSPDKQTLTLLSDAAADQPRFRLSYTRQKDEKLAIKFEIAPPGKPDAFKTYLEGTAVRESGPADGAKKPSR